MTLTTDIAIGKIVKPLIGK